MHTCTHLWASAPPCYKNEMKKTPSGASHLQDCQQPGPASHPRVPVPSSHRVCAALPTGGVGCAHASERVYAQAKEFMLLCLQLGCAHASVCVYAQAIEFVRMGSVHACAGYLSLCRLAYMWGVCTGVCVCYTKLRGTAACPETLSTQGICVRSHKCVLTCTQVWIVPLSSLL